MLGEVTMRCMVCSAPFGVEDSPHIEKNTIVCGECNERLSGIFDGDRPTFYQQYNKEIVAEIGVELAMDGKRPETLGFYMGGYRKLDWDEATCACPRQDRRWATEN